VRPVSFGENRIEVALMPGAPKTLYNDLSRRLESWTGARWLIVPSDAEGGETLAETEATTRRAAEDDARQDPAVAAILKRFPGAKIIGITLRDAAPADGRQGTRQGVPGAEAYATGADDPAFDNAGFDDTMDDEPDDDVSGGMNEEL
jgi:DNA polymerase III subunit gamma/tau